MFVWIFAPYRLHTDATVSEKHTLSMFRAEDGDSMFLHNVGQNKKRANLHGAKTQNILSSSLQISRSKINV
jgi:hypothetical protein